MDRPPQKYFEKIFFEKKKEKWDIFFDHLPAQKHKRLYQNWSPRSGTKFEKTYLKKYLKCWVTFLTFFVFLTFFQISSRTSGINFDTIACVFELVDGQKKCLLFFDFFFFRKLVFRNIFGGAYPFISHPQKWSKKKFQKISFFSSYPTLSYPTPFKGLTAQRGL